MRDFAYVIEAHKLPPAPDTILDMRWIMGKDEWYLKTAKGWYWLDVRRDEWLFLPLGVPD